MSNREFFQQMLAGEFDRFRNVIAALPADKLNYKPDPKARSAGELVGHLIGHNEDLVELMTQGHINHRMTVEFQNLDDAVSKFERSYRELEAHLKAVTEDAWMKAGDFKVGDHVAMNAPAQALAWMLFMDSVHHRGQLSTHIRPMGGKVPSIYGPSADSQMPS
jgi:uncharacterized damage-inducible protein DinB